MFLPFNESKPLQAQPRISVITPLYNAKRYIAETVESVIAQTTSEWEYVIVDDGSKDGSAAIVRSFVERDTRIRLIQQENRGVAVTRNVGVSQAHATSEYLFFLDADDTLAPEALEEMSAYLDAHPHVGLVGCQIRRIDAEGQPIHLRHGMNHRTRWAPGVLGIPHDLPPQIKNTPFVTFFCGSGQGPYAMYRRSVYEQTNGWDESLNGGHEDTDMFCQMALLAEVHYIPDRLYNYRSHPENKSSQSNAMAVAAERHRHKWETLEVDDAHQQQVLNQARAYFYSTYVPFRHLRVGTMALRQFVRSRKLSDFRWGLRCISYALRDFVKFRLSRLI